MLHVRHNDENLAPVFAAFDRHPVGQVKKFCCELDEAIVACAAASADRAHASALAPFPSSSVCLIARIPCSIMPAMGSARSLGSKSAIHTMRLALLASAKTCSEALWCCGRPSTTAQ